MTTELEIHGKKAKKVKTYREGIHIHHSLSNKRIDSRRFSNSTFAHYENGQSAHTLQFAYDQYRYITRNCWNCKNSMKDFKIKPEKPFPLICQTIPRVYFGWPQGTAETQPTHEVWTPLNLKWNNKYEDKVLNQNLTGHIANWKL